MDFEKLLSDLIADLAQGNNIGQAESNFNLFLRRDPCLLINFLIINFKTSNEKFSAYTITLLGRAAVIVSGQLCQTGDALVHQNIQSSLLSLFQKPSLELDSLLNISNAVSLFAKIYYPNWESLLNDLMVIIQLNLDDNVSAAVIDCIAKCINNDSICYDQKLLLFVQNILSNGTVINGQYLSMIKLCFSLFQKNHNINFSLFSQQICSTISKAPRDLIEKCLNELSNLEEKSFSIFFEPSYNILIPFLFSIISNQQHSKMAQNHSISLLTSIICNKSDRKKFIGNMLNNFYNLLILVLQRDFIDLAANNTAKVLTIEAPKKYSEIEFETNTILIVRDSLHSIAYFFGGNKDFAMHIIETSLENNIQMLSQLNSDSALMCIVANLVAFECVADEIIEYINFPILIEKIAMMYSEIAFSNASRQNSYDFLRYEAIVSLSNVMTAFQNESADFCGQLLVPAIINSLNFENNSGIANALLSLLDKYLFIFEDYEKMIPNIMMYLSERFSNFDFNQQSIVISCFQNCAVFSLENGFSLFSPYVQSIVQFLIQVLSDSCRNYPRSLFFACLNALPTFHNFIPIDIIFQISNFIFIFLSSINFEYFDSQQMDIINDVLRRLIVNCPKDHTLVFSNKAIEFIFSIATQDITIEKNSFDENWTELQSHSPAKIYSINEALVTILKFIQTIPGIMHQYFHQIIQIIEKLIHNDFSLSLSYKSTQILMEVLNYPECAQPDAAPIICHFLPAIISMFNLIKKNGIIDNNNRDEIHRMTINVARVLKKLLEFVGLHFIVDPSIPNSIISFICKELYEMWQLMRETDFSDEFFGDFKNMEMNDEVEREIGYIFEPIFKHFSQQISSYILSDCFNTFPLDINYISKENMPYISLMFYGFWIYYSSFSILCTSDQLCQIVSFFQHLICHPNYLTRLNSIESLLFIISNSGKFMPERISAIIAVIDHVVSNEQDITKMYVVPQLLIIIENQIKARIENNNNFNFCFNENLSNMVLLLLKCLPVEKLIPRSYILSSANGLITLISTNHPLIQNIKALALIGNLALVFLLVYKPNKEIKNQLILIVKKIFLGSQGLCILEMFKTLSLTEDFKNECIDYIAILCN